MAYAPAIVPPPDTDELAAYLNLQARTPEGDEQLDAVLSDSLDYELARLDDALLIADGASPPTTLPGPVARAVLMRAAALWRRRNSVNGFDGYDDLGTVPVRASDPDVERLVDRYRAWNYA